MSLRLPRADTVDAEAAALHSIQHNMQHTLDTPRSEVSGTSYTFTEASDMIPSTAQLREMLQQREADLLLAAEIGETLLEKNRKPHAQDINFLLYSSLTHALHRQSTSYSKKSRTHTLHRSNGR
eukprot:3867664-Rhodomonas_salina.3